MTPVLHKYSTGHLALRHLTFLLQSSLFLCLAVLFMTLPKHVYSTCCESPLQTDRDQHSNLTFSISASEWDFQSFDYKSQIPLLLGLVKTVLRSLILNVKQVHKKQQELLQISFYLPLGFLLKHKTLNSLLVHEFDSWSRILSSEN